MASRRQQAATDDSAYSAGSEVRHDAAIARQYLASAAMALLPSDVILQRSLSVKSVLSTSSSFARRSQQAAARPDLQQIVQIGAGMQGVIFEQVR